MSAALQISGAGMCCSVGLTAPSARTAIWSGMNRFRESQFVDTEGEPVIVAGVPMGGRGGAHRMAAMLREAFRESVRPLSAISPSTTALLLVTAEEERPGYCATWAHACFEAVCDSMGGRLNAASRVFPLGRAGFGSALAAARPLLAERRVARAVIAGVDSYLDARTINGLLRSGRLSTPETPSGIIPGEGAGAVCVELARDDVTAGCRVVGLGVATEPATLANDEPQQASGLTAALRAALVESGRRPEEMDFRATDWAGEPFYAYESGLALTRVFDQHVAEFPVVQIAESLGETGAAVGPLSVAYVAGLMARRKTAGPRCLLHLASDGGARAAAVLEYRPWGNGGDHVP